MKAIGWIVAGIAAYLFITRREQLDFSIPATEAGAIASNFRFLGPPVASGAPGVDAAASGDTAQTETPITAVSPDFQLPVAVLPSSGYAPHVNWVPFRSPLVFQRNAQ